MNTRADLAKAKYGAILQVGAYNTDSYQNITDESTQFEYDTVVRLQSYDGDNWVKFITPTYTVTGAGYSLVNGNYTKNVTNKVWDGDTPNIRMRYVPQYTYWLIEIKNLEDPEVGEVGDWIATYLNTGGDVDNIPETGWIGQIPLGTNPVPTVPDTTTSAADGEGLLLQDGAEITVLVYQNDYIGTTGASLNIVPVTD